MIRCWIYTSHYESTFFCDHQIDSTRKPPFFHWYWELEILDSSLKYNKQIQWCKMCLTLLSNACKESHKDQQQMKITQYFTVRAFWTSIKILLSSLFIHLRNDSREVTCSSPWGSPLGSSDVHRKRKVLQWRWFIAYMTHL